MANRGVCWCASRSPRRCAWRTPASSRSPCSTGGLRSSAQDPVRFGRAIVQGRDGPLEAAAQRLVTPLAAFRGGQIGHAVIVDGPPERRTWSHHGLTGVYRAQLRFARRDGAVVALELVQYGRSTGA